MIKKILTTVALLATATAVSTPTRAVTRTASPAQPLSDTSLSKATSTLATLSSMMTHAASDPSIMLSNINWQETTAQTSPGEYTPYGAGSCTAFVWAYYHALGINLPPFMGMAYTWAASANTSVQAGVIVVFPPGVDGASSVGHVGVVTAVNPDGSFNIVEGNFNGVWGNVRNNLSPAGLYFINPLTMNK